MRCVRDFGEGGGRLEVDLFGGGLCYWLKMALICYFRRCSICIIFKIDDYEKKLTCGILEVTAR